MDETQIQAMWLQSSLLLVQKEAGILSSACSTWCAPFLLRRRLSAGQGFRGSFKKSACRSTFLNQHQRRTVFKSAAGWPKTSIQGCGGGRWAEALQSYLPWLRNVWRNSLHVEKRFLLTGWACCAKMPASSSEIFTKAGSCRNKLNRTTSNFTTEMKTACGVIKNQASNRPKKKKNVVTVYPESESHFENSLFFHHFSLHVSQCFGP